jgi:hypothetical protein
MAKIKENIIEGRQSILYVVLGILVFGSIWGLLEATLGGFLNLIIFPNKGAIMAGIGVAIMAMALAIYRKPAMLPFIGIVAASFKWFNAWLLFVPLNAIQVVNPAMAIVFESLAFGLVAVFLMKRMEKNPLFSVGAGALAGFLAAVAWVYFAIYVMNAPAYARVVFTAGGFISNQAIIQAVFLGIFAPLGYLAGTKLVAKPFPQLTKKMPVYYASALATVALCWGLSAVAFVSGL